MPQNVPPPAGEKATRAASQPVFFYVPATTSILERRPRTLKHNDTFAVFDHFGNVSGGEGSAEGLYHNDTRYLSRLLVLVNGRTPLLLSSTVQDNNLMLSVDLTNPDFVVSGRIDLPRNMIHIVRSKFLWANSCYERLALRNFSQDRRAIDLKINFHADFADIFEVRGHQRERRGETQAALTDTGVTFAYHGLDGLVRRSLIRFDPKPDQLDEDSALFHLELPAQRRTSLFCTISCKESDHPADQPSRHFFSCLREARRTLSAASSHAASVETSNAIFNEVLCRSMADLRMLLTDTQHGPYPYAGIPWFSTAFGRDAVITAIEMLWVDPTIARGVLMFLASTQAKSVQAEIESEPGKILHETRYGELARLGETPFAAYYGSVDSTPLFIVLAGLYFNRTGDLKTVASLWPHIEAALDWIDTYADRDGDGFIEYHSAAENGLVNQGWKDSADSIFHKNGSDPEGPIALCEVQGYVFAAKRHAAVIAAAIGFAARARELEAEADRLRELFESKFWCPDIGTYALALDGQKRACEVRSSNAGHVLFSGIASDQHAKLVADQLMDPVFFTGWGIRTIGSAEARYNPMAYHNGSIWPHDNALIGLGFANYGLKQHMQRLFSGLFDAAAYMDLRRFPELFCGFRRIPGKGPTFYPVACSPQAWASGAPFALIQACLGLEVNFATEKVRFRQPRLPEFLEEVTIRSLSVGQSRLDILLRSYGTDVSVNVLRREGDATVEVLL